MENINKADFLKFQANKQIRHLFRNILYLIEDLRDKNELDPSNYDRLRKRILDHGNDCIRELEQDIDKIL